MFYNCVTTSHLEFNPDTKLWECYIEFVVDIKKGEEEKHVTVSKFHTGKDQQVVASTAVKWATMDLHIKLKDDKNNIVVAH